MLKWYELNSFGSGQGPMKGPREEIGGNSWIAELATSEKGLSSMELAIVCAVQRRMRRQCMNCNQLVEWELAGETGEKLPHCQFVRQKSHTTWPYLFKTSVQNSEELLLIETIFSM
jgi:hypothetical protein